MTNSKIIEICCKISKFPLIMEATLLIGQYILR